MIYFLFKHGKFINAHTDDLYEIALDVARSNRTIDEETRMLKSALGPFVVNLK